MDVERKRKNTVFSRHTRPIQHPHPAPKQSTPTHPQPHLQPVPNAEVPYLASQRLTNIPFVNIENKIAKSRVFGVYSQVLANVETCRGGGFRSLMSLLAWVWGGWEGEGSGEWGEGSGEEGGAGVMCRMGYDISWFDTPYDIDQTL